MHQNFRDCAAWRDEGLPVSTTNNEVAKLYDACISMAIGWYDDPTVGDISTCLKRMKELDPEFVMTYVIQTGGGCLGTTQTPRLDQDLKNEIDLMVQLSEKAHVTQREKKHVNAVKLWSEGYIESASTVWDSISEDFPTDAMAIRNNHASYFYIGKRQQLRDNLGKVIHRWNETMPNYSELLAYYAFALAEDDAITEAEVKAKRALELNRFNGWATHALSHTYENSCRTDVALKHLYETEAYWSAKCGLKTHNYWHLALFHVNKGEYEAALGVYDNKINKGAPAESVLDMLDSSSLLFRLEMEGVNVGGRWEDAYELCRPHLDDHILVFNDFHLLLACVGAKKQDAADCFMTSVKQYMSENNCQTNQRTTSDVGMRLFEAVLAYDSGDYGAAVDLVYPVRYEIHVVGASRAQRDVIFLFLIHSALRSNQLKHQRIARSLIMERKARNKDCPMTDRLALNILSRHIADGDE